MPEPILRGYHAHVYFDGATAPDARRLRDAVAEAFPVTLGPWNDRLVGPHPSWSYEIGFPVGLRDALVPWLAAHRGALTVLVHRLSDKGDRADHSEQLLWMGAPLPLRLDRLLS